MLKNIGIVAAVVVVLLVAFVAVAATQPNTFRVQRTTSIQAPPEKIFAILSDFRRWEVWSPYEKMDPDMKRSFSGADRGQGAVYEWQGQGDAGQGRMEITKTTTPRQITLSLDLFKPFACHNTVEFTLEPDGESTNVTWAMHGPNSFMGKIMHTLIDMDKLVGSQFEEGLANLKTAAET